MMKITPKQVERVHRLVRELCANCDEDGNCILLDDGEAHRCVQLISIYGIYCNYFKETHLFCASGNGTAPYNFNGNTFGVYNQWERFPFYF